jgi:hypothetical protein
MKPIPQSMVGCLTGVIGAMLKEANLGERSSVEHCIARILEGYAKREMDAYADDPANPKHVLIMGKCRGIVTKEEITTILWIYSVPEERGSEESLAAFRNMIDNYSTMFHADAILGSDFQFRGCRMGTAAFWRSLGFERQETVYVKLKKP